jgi:hypothetical protein
MGIMELTAHTPPSDKPDRQAGAEAEITPAEMEEFWSLFRDWQMSFPTYEQLLAGGTGDLEPLAKRCLRWARRDQRESDEIK